MSRDIIITAFSCGGKMKCKKEALLFKDPPLILNIPGGSKDGFIKTAKSIKDKGSILDPLFNAKNINPRRVCLISFDVGWSWVTEVLRCKKDLSRIDTILIIDGIHTSSLQAWIKYAKLAVEGDSRLWMVHTQNQPAQGTSARTTNAKIAKRVKLELPIITVPDYILNVEPFEKPITIYSKHDTPKRKIYQKDSLCLFEQYGNLVRFEYQGNKTQDQIYTTQYVQPIFWKWLRELWEAEDGVLFTKNKVIC